MIPGKPEDDLETLMNVELTLDDIVSLDLLTKVVTIEPIDDVEFTRSRMVEEFDTDMAV